MEENIEARFYAYMQEMADKLIPISQMITMSSVEAMVSKWTGGDVKKNTLLVEPPDWIGRDLRAADPVKIFTAAISIVSPGNFRDEKDVQEINREADMILDQLLAKMIADSAPKPNNLMRNVGNEVEVIAVPPLNQKTMIGKRMQFAFKTHAKIYIKEDLWQ